MITVILVAILVIEVIRLVLSIRDTNLVHKLNAKSQEMARAWQAEQIQWRDAEIIELKELAKGSKELTALLEEIERAKGGDDGLSTDG